MKSNEIILLQEVGRFIGVEEIFFNSEGFCLLQLQDRFSLIIRNDTIEQRLIIMAVKRGRFRNLLILVS